MTANIDMYNNEWSSDCVIGSDDLAKESVKISALHGKYSTFLVKERSLYSKYNEKRKMLLKQLYRYYSGKGNNTTFLTEIQMKPFKDSLEKQEVKMYVEADPKMVAVNIKLAETENAIKYLEDILKHIHSRGYNIKAAIDYLRFIHGT